MSTELVNVSAGEVATLAPGLIAGKAGELTVFQQDLKATMEVVRENIGVGKIGEFDLPRIKVPSVGSTNASTVKWVLDGPDGQEYLDHLDVICVAFRDTRAYWPVAYGEGESGPPQCSSRDGLIGIGDPGGECAKCAFAQFGSSTKEGSDGQACGNPRELIVYRAGNMLPEVVQVPPTSTKNAKKFFIGLASRSIPYYSILMRLKIVVDKNKGGIKYAKIDFSQVERLTP